MKKIIMLNKLGNLAMYNNYINDLNNKIKKQEEVVN